MKKRSPDTYIDDYHDYLNRLLLRVGFQRGWLKTSIHSGQVGPVELKLLPPKRPHLQTRPCTYSLDELTLIFHNRLRKTLKLRFDFGRVKIEIDQCQIKRSFFTIQSRPEEKKYLSQVFQSAPPRGRKRRAS
jgi:hypothetical protein